MNTSNAINTSNSANVGTVNISSLGYNNTHSKSLKYVASQPVKYVPVSTANTGASSKWNNQSDTTPTETTTFTKEEIHKPAYKNPTYPQQHPAKKYLTPDGKRLAAGGIILFEETTAGKGIWVVEEEDNVKGTINTDIGGRYNYDDGDIIATISREFREETYNVHEIPYSQLSEIPLSHHVYVNGYDGTPSYVCILAHVHHFNISFNSQKIKESRKKILLANPDIPGEWYKTVDVKFLLLKDIIGNKYKLSKRLFAVLKVMSTNFSQYSTEIADFFTGFKFY